MALTLEARIAEAVKCELSVVSIPFESEVAFDRVYVPTFDLPSLTTARVQVITPYESEAVPGDRGSETVKVNVTFLVVAQAEASDLATIDALTLFVERLQDKLRRRENGANKTLGGATWVPPHVNNPKFDYLKLKEDNIFLSATTFTYQISRSF